MSAGAIVGREEWDAASHALLPAPGRIDGLLAYRQRMGLRRDEHGAS